ncbi:MAG: hypothetical protein J0H44_24045 [Alphaproteobacteria bacterium]|nr:hypothetical protein [Alphaproteobacteria bacterium]
MLFELRKESIIDLLIGVGDALGIFKRQTLGRAEPLAVAPSQEFRDLVQAAVGFRQTDGIDVNSKWTAVDRRHA